MAAPKGNKYAGGKGRPTKYTLDLDEQARKLCLLGYTDSDLATYLEVDESTINNWKIEHPSFLESIKEGKEYADIKVVQSLYKRSLGYKYDEIHYEKIELKVDGVDEDDDIKAEPYKKKVIIKEIVPDVTAQIFWLKNRQKKKWRDKIEHGVTDNDGNDVITIFEIPNNGRNKDNPASAGLSAKGAK